MKARPLAILALSLSLLSLSATRASAQELVPRPSPVHVMVGVGGDGGGFFDRAGGLMGGAHVYAGIHFFGVEIYGLSQGFIGSLTMGPHSGSVEGIVWNSAMLGFGVGPFHLAAGPSLDFAWGCSDDQAGADCYHGAAMFGLDGRLALQFGNFEVSTNIHPTFYGSSTVTGLSVGLGWAW